MEGVGDVFNRDFAVKNFVGTGIRTRYLLTCFFFILALQVWQRQPDKLKDSAQMKNANFAWLIIILG